MQQVPDSLKDVTNHSVRECPESVKRTRRCSFLLLYQWLGSADAGGVSLRRAVALNRSEEPETCRGGALMDLSRLGQPWEGRWTMLLLMLVSGLPELSASEKEGGPAVFFESPDQNPFLRTLAWAPVSVGLSPAAGQWHWQFAMQITNHSRRVQTAQESLSLDGESDVLSWSASYGLTANWSLRVLLPWVRYRGGGLDGFIEQWHKIWGLSNSDRQGPRNRLAMRYENPRGEVLAVTQSVAGIGDLRVGFQRDLSAWVSAGRAALMVGAELPSGEADRLLGNGEVDGFAAVGWEGRAYGYRTGIRLGVTTVDFRQVLFPARHWASYGSVAVLGRPWRRWVPRLQWDFHTPVADSGLVELGAAASWLTVGVSYLLSEHLRVEGAMVEDLFSDPVPDFGLRFAVEVSR